MKNHITFATYRISEVSDELFKQCSILFSENYGTYSNYVSTPNKKPGDRVTMSRDFMKRYFGSIPDCRVVCAFDGSLLVGHAFYLRKNYAQIGTMTWVLQLVVKTDYRLQKIGQKLLHSIWGFSNDIAWGLATANPYTVRTLEAVTFRRVNPKTIQKHLKQIQCMTDDIWFAKDAEITVNSETSLIKTKFAIDHSDNKYDETWLLGDLPPLYEWLAFTFKSQDIDSKLFSKNYPDLVKFSEERLREAYSRMEMKNQSWTYGTSSEVDFISEKCKLSGSPCKIIDFGCGIGRHSIEFAARGHMVCGIDFSKTHLTSARKSANDKGLNIQFIEHDCRDIRFFKSKPYFEQFDVALCLYDVVGSFPNEDDNEAIIKSAYSSLRPGGYFVISVMNFELTESRAKHRCKALEDDPKTLLNLKPSNIMQKTGNVFDPDYYAVDTSTHMVYRKEQFLDDGFISAEYVIRDIRYYKREIVSLLQENHFDVLESSFVSAGKWYNPIQNGKKDKAKEILVICKKECPSSKISSFFRRLL